MLLRHPAALPLACTLISLAVLVPWYWRPSFWTDEAATASAVGRSWPELFTMLGRIDVVHGAYYVIVKAVTDAFGISEITMRAPSVLAGAGTVFLTAVIGRRLGGPLVGLLAGLVLLFLPRFEYAATDGRSYALSVLFSTASVLALLRLRDTGRARYALGFAFFSTLATALSFYCVTLLAVLAVVLVMDPALRRRWKALLISAAPAVVTAGMLAMAASAQAFQVAWLPKVDAATVLDVFFLQWFGDGTVWPRVPLTTPVIWQEAVSTPALCLLGLVTITAAVITGDRRVTRFLLLWVFLPTALIIGASWALGTSYYLPRYLSFTLPGVALLMALGLAGLARRGTTGRRTAALLMALIAGLGVLSLSSQRSTFDRAYNDDFKFISYVMSREARPGDAFAVQTADDLFLAAYPRSFHGLVDVTLDKPARERGLIFDQRSIVNRHLPQLRDERVVWSIHRKGRPTQDRFLASHGFVEQGRWTGNAHVIVKFVRR